MTYKTLTFLLTYLLIIGITFGYYYGKEKYDKGYADGACHGAVKLTGLDVGTCKVSLTRNSSGAIDIKIKLFPKP